VTLGTDHLVDDATGSNLYEHLAGVNDLLLARATFAVAVKRWPDAKISSEDD
jgi:hypothetical protein